MKLKGNFYPSCHNDKNIAIYVSNSIFLLTKKMKIN